MIVVACSRIGQPRRAASQQFAQSHAEGAAAEAGYKSGAARTEQKLGDLGTKVMEEFEHIGQQRGASDAKARAERERQLRLLEQMARGGQSARLASEYQRGRNRSYY